MSNTTGKYTCGSCGGQVMVTRPGEGTITCCEEPMTKSVPQGASR